LFATTVTASTLAGVVAGGVPRVVAGGGVVGGGGSGDGVGDPAGVGESAGVGLGVSLSVGLAGSAVGVS
jgi:hypothetical protein